MSDQSKIQTIGPADPNAPTRSKGYAVLAVAFPVIGALATFGVLSTDQANAITGFATAALGLMGAFGFGFVANKTKTQVDNGTFAEAPPVPELPAVPALEQLKILRDVADQELNRGVVKAQDAADVIGGLLGNIPIVGKPMADAVNTADDALDMLGAFKR